MNRTAFLIIIFVAAFNLVFAQTPPDRTWYRDSYKRKLSVKEKWSESSTGLKNGVYIKYFKDGERELLGHYSNGKKTGEWVQTKYYSSRTKTTITFHYKNDKLHGSWLEVSENGKTLEKGMYEYGKKVGQWLEYPFLKGHVKGMYVNGNKDGWWSDYKGYYYYKWTENQEYKPYKIVKSNSYAKGYRTLFDNGEFVKVIDANGKNEAEECGYKNCIWALGSTTKFSNKRIIELCEEFLTDFPQSQYAPEIKQKLNAKKKDIENSINEGKRMQEALERAKQGDSQAIKTYFGEHSYLVALNYIVNHSFGESKKKYPYGNWDSKYTGYPNKSNAEAEVFKGILKNASNPIVSESMKMWDSKGTLIDKFNFKWSKESGLSVKWAAKKYYQSDYHIRVYVLNDEVAVKEYGSKGIKLYHSGKLVHTTTDGLFNGFSSLNEDGKYVVLYSYFNLYTNQIDVESFGNLMRYMNGLSDANEKKCYELFALQLEANKVKVKETRKNSSEALKAVYLSILHWQLGNREKSIQALAQSKEKFYKYNSLQESWQSCGAGAYTKFFVSKYLNSDNSVRLTDEKEYIKSIKKI